MLITLGFTHLTVQTIKHVDITQRLHSMLVYLIEQARFEQSVGCQSWGTNILIYQLCFTNKMIAV